MNGNWRTEIEEEEDDYDLIYVCIWWFENYFVVVYKSCAKFIFVF